MQHQRSLVNSVTRSGLIFRSIRLPPSSTATDCLLNAHEQCNLRTEKCYLKARARDTVSFHLYAEMHQLPLTNMTVNAQLFVKGNGYRPFLYNDTLDFCKFVKNPNRYMFWKIIYEIQKPYSTVNHSCPINDLKESLVPKHVPLVEKKYLHLTRSHQSFLAHNDITQSSVDP
ncbi:uncharacterized protein LOC131994711 [Stomoxys calcitrans]|uniref:uncharacterized protein LOC131994711 n=1 Tax=Stomoxys calcitrans TaxID=35570 RepID=UPI0027E32FDB|nr:uncharacterized protein LOC131994711 [Stomoxys calcitrans]